MGELIGRKARVMSDCVSERTRVDGKKEGEQERQGGWRWQWRISINLDLLAIRGFFFTFVQVLPDWMSERMPVLMCMREREMGWGGWGLLW